MNSETTSKVEGLRAHTPAPLWNFLHNTSDQIRPIAQSNVWLNPIAYTGAPRSSLKYQSIYAVYIGKAGE